MFQNVAGEGKEGLGKSRVMPVFKWFHEDN